MKKEKCGVNHYLVLLSGIILGLFLMFFTMSIFNIEFKQMGKEEDWRCVEWKNETIEKLKENVLFATNGDPSIGRNDIFNCEPLHDENSIFFGYECDVIFRDIKEVCVRECNQKGECINNL